MSANARFRSLHRAAVFCSCAVFFCSVSSLALGGRLEDRLGDRLGGRSFSSDIGSLLAVGLQPLGNPLFAFRLGPPQQQTNQTSQTKSQKLRNPLNDLLDEAQAAVDKGDFAAAIPPLQKFIAEKPDVAYAHFQLAYAYTNLQRPAEARPEYERAIAIDPKFSRLT